MKLNFKLHIKEKISKAKKGIYVINKLRNVFPRKSLITIYKSFAGPHLDYGHLIMINQIMKDSVNKFKVFNIMLPLQSLVLWRKHLDFTQWNRVRVFKFRRMFRKLGYFYKIKSTGLPSYLFELIPKTSHMYNMCSLEDVAKLYSKTDIIKYLFFMSTISELDLKIQKSKTLYENLRPFWLSKMLPLKLGGPFLSQFIMYIALLVKITYKVETWSQSPHSTQVQWQFPRSLESIVFV